MLNGRYRGEAIGSGTVVWQFSEAVKAGKMTQQEFMDAESCMSRSAGHCMTMGTASTMACMVESLGLSLPGNAAIPAVDSRRNVLAHETGRRIVAMVHEDLRISKILKREAFLNAIRANAAIGGSTNAVIHLIAFAGRVGVPLTLDDWDKYGRDVRTILDLQPSGRFLMEDFYYAGGLPAVLEQAGRAWAARRRRADGERADDGREREGRADLEQRSDSRLSKTHWSRAAAWRCCAAIFAPMARC